MPWRIQCERTLRSFGKLHEMRRDFAEYDDDVAHFFMDITHLEYWILNDRAVNKNADTMRKLVRESDPLTVCRSIANGQ